MTKSIILCADDFGYNTAVSQGIINLVAKQRLSAVSCMTNMPAWENHIAALLKFRDTIDIGLHFNLLKPSLPQLIAVCFLRQLNNCDIETEFQTQLDIFKKSTGFLPDHIDGHQHIQQLPGISTALINVIKRNYSEKMPLVRLSSNGLYNSLKTSSKAVIVHILGASKLAKLTKQHAVPTNTSFAGFSDFNPKADYKIQFETYLKQINDHGLIMCHPGLAEPFDSQDSIAASRVNEYAFFSSDAFIELLQQNEILLCRA